MKSETILQIAEHVGAAINRRSIWPPTFKRSIDFTPEQLERLVEIVEVKPVFEEFEKWAQIEGITVWTSDSKQCMRPMAWAAWAAWQAAARPQHQPLTPEEQGYVPLSDDGKSVFIDGFGEVPLAYPSMQPPLPEQPEQEPVARVNDDGFIVETGLLIAPGTLLYATPPKREWVGLTPEDIENCYGGEVDDFARAIEGKLKEKNT